MIDREGISRGSRPRSLRKLNEAFVPWPSWKLASETTAVAVAASDGVGQPLVARESIALRAKADKRPVSSSTLPPASVSTSLRADALTHERNIMISRESLVNTPRGAGERDRESQPAVVKRLRNEMDNLRNQWAPGL